MELSSAYYPSFRSMFRNVVAALNEAQDITLFLKPLGQHFQVSLLHIVHN
jgi:dynein heavy chain